VVQFGLPFTQIVVDDALPQTLALQPGLGLLEQVVVRVVLARMMPRDVGQLPYGRVSGRRSGLATAGTRKVPVPGGLAESQHGAIGSGLAAPRTWPLLAGRGNLGGLLSGGRDQSCGLRLGGPEQVLDTLAKTGIGGRGG
jgi:hypothetical protein